MTPLRFLASLLPLVLVATAAAADPGPPRGWFVAGSNPSGYKVGAAAAAGAKGKLAAYVKARAGTRSDGFGTLMQCVGAENYIGKRLRLRSRLKAVDAQAVQLWMRVDAGKEAVAFYNMADDPLRGTSDWRETQVVLDVPGGSTAICFGFFLAGGAGEAWADDIALEMVGKDIPVSQMSMPKAPVNLGFDR